jgi:hypothetical protein
MNPAADSDKRAAGKNGKRNCNRGKPTTRVRQLAAEHAVERLQLFQCDSSTLGQRNMAQKRCACVHLTPDWQLEACHSSTLLGQHSLGKQEACNRQPMSADCCSF